MSQKNFLLSIFLVAIFVGGYFFYLSQRSYQNYKILTRKIAFLTQELQNIRIEKSKLQFQLSALQDNKKLNGSLLNSKDFIAKNEVMVDIVPPDLTKREFDLKSYILYMLLLLALIAYFFAYYFELDFLKKMKERSKKILLNIGFFRKIMESNFIRRRLAKKAEALKTSSIREFENPKEKASAESKKKKLFTLKMLR